MSSLIESCIAFVTAHHALAYALVGLCALMEAIPVIGTFIPGSGVIIAVSSLVAVGDLNLAATLLAAIAGGVLGDGSAFLIGKVWKTSILNTWPLAQHPDIIRRCEQFFARYGIWAILVARFLPPIRAFVPIIAGAVGMRAARFFPINIVAVILWACAYVLPGAFAGTLWKTYSQQIEDLAVPALAIGAATALTIWLFRRKRALG